MAYTKDGIMAQILVAFGQGTGTVRVSHDAAVELHSRYFDKITTDVINNWDREGVQVLERIRAIGRLMAHDTIQTGATAILGAGAVNTAAPTVELKSQTTLCGGPPPVATGVV
jgi:hypothetical protein